MTASLKVVTQEEKEITHQDASLDIWDSKYRLKSKTGEILDKDIDSTFVRVARALADVEPGRPDHFPAPQDRRFPGRT